MKKKTIRVITIIMVIVLLMGTLSALVFADGSETINITGEKDWDNDLFNQNSVELQLLRNGLKFGNPITIINGVPSYTWENLEKVDLNGVDYNYTVEEVVFFKDAKFKEQIFLTLKASYGVKNRDNVVYVNDMKLIKWNLVLNNKMIEDITGIEHATNTNVIEMNNNKIRDLTPLKKLNNLVSLKLDKNYIEDLTPLKNLTNLKDLKLRDNMIADLKPLENLTNLYYLNLERNRIKDISMLGNLVNLKENEGLSTLVGNRIIPTNENLAIETFLKTKLWINGQFHNQSLVKVSVEFYETEIIKGEYVQTAVLSNGKIGLYLNEELIDIEDIKHDPDVYLGDRYFGYSNEAIFYVPTYDNIGGGATELIQGYSIKPIEIPFGYKLSGINKARQVNGLMLGREEFDLPYNQNNFIEFVTPDVMWRSADDTSEDLTIKLFLEKETSKFPNPDATIIVEYRDIDTNREIDTDLYPNLKLDTYDITAREITGYNLIGDKTVSVKLENDGELVKVIFNIKAKVKLTGNITVHYKDVDTKNTLDIDLYENVDLGKHNIKIKDINGYTIIGSRERLITLSEDKEHIFITVDCKRNSTPSIPSTSTIPEVITPEPTPEEKAPPLVDLVEGDFVSRWLFHKPIQEAPVKTEVKGIVSVNVSKEQNAFMKENGLSPRLYYWHEKSERWVALSTINKLNRVETYKDTNENLWIATFGIKQPTFVDVTGYEWYVERANRANGLAIIEGRPTKEGTVVLDAQTNIDRKEFYAMTGRIFGAVPKGQTSLYNELDFIEQGKGKDWYKPYIQEFYDKKIISKVFSEEEVFEDITRQEVVMLLTKMLERVGEEVEYINMSNFKDTQHLQNLKIANIINGYEDKTLRLNQTITRIEAITLLLNTLENLGW